jgi:hypothetical protein
MMTLGAGYAGLAVVLAFVLVGSVFFLLARRALDRKKLPRTLARLAGDAKQVLETAK